MKDFEFMVLIETQVVKQSTPKSVRGKKEASLLLQSALSSMYWGLQQISVYVIKSIYVIVYKIL